MSRQQLAPGPRSLAQKLAALSDFEKRGEDIKADEIAAKHGITTATLYNWASLKRENKLTEPKPTGGAAKKPAQFQRDSRNFTPEFRAAVVAQFEAGEKAQDIAIERGIDVSNVYRWAGQKKSGGVLARVLPKDPAPARRSTVTIEASAPHSLELENLLLRRSNDKLRRMIAIAMEDL